MRARLSRDRVGDETLPLVRSRGMRACLSWDRVEMNPASREIEPRSIVFPAPFRQGSSVQLRVLQRLLVLKVVDSAVLHPGLLHMRPLQLWLESRVPWTAWTSGCLRITATSKLWRNPDAPDDHDGCIDSRLGSSVRGNASFGTVAGISEPVALKPPGAGSSLLSPKGFSATAGPAKCTDSHRQHVCVFVHKSLRLSDCIRFGPGTAVSLSGRDWNTCLNHCLPPFERTETVRRQPLLLNHRPHRVRTPRLQFAPSVFLRFYIDRSSSFRQSIQFLGAMVGVRTAKPYRN